MKRDGTDGTEQTERNGTLKKTLGGTKLKLWQDRQWRLNILFTLPFLIIVGGLLGWIVYKRSLYEFAKPTSVQIIRPQHDQLKQVDVTVTNTDTVHDLSSELKSMKPFPSGIISCPADFGVTYTLIFKDGNRVLWTANADPSGCEQIRLSTGQTLWGVDNDPNAKAFWNTLAKSIGLANSNDLVGSRGR